MQVTIKDVSYTFCSKVAENDTIRQSFCKLAKKTFGIDFEAWYAQGYWGPEYLPHVLMDGDRVVANVSVNIMPMVWKGQKRLYIQLGTVMTDLDYRGRGLSACLMTRVIEEWQERCDSIYLFANDSVLDFYPRFGFEKAKEYQAKMPIQKVDGEIRKLDLSCPEDKQLLLNAYKASNPFASLTVTENEGLLMFYCSSYLKDNLYYLKEFNAVVIAEYKNASMICYEVFCDREEHLKEILAISAQAETKEVIFGFSLKKEDAAVITQCQEEDTTLFLLQKKENLFADSKLMFPLLSHA